METSSICRELGQTSRPSTLLIFLMLVLLALSFSTAKELMAADEQGTNISANKAIVAKFMEEVITNRKADAIDGLVQPDVLLQLQSNWRSPISGTSQVIGKDNLKKHYEAFYSIWDKKAEWLKVKTVEVVAEGDTVAVRAERVYMDRQTKEQVNRTAMAFYKLKDGKIAALYLLVADPID